MSAMLVIMIFVCIGWAKGDHFKKFVDDLYDEIYHVLKCSVLRVK